MPALLAFGLDLAVWTIPILLAVAVHETAYAAAGARLGGGTVGLNPVRYLSPVGTFLVPALLVLLKSPVMFAWGRPAPIDLGRTRPAFVGPLLTSAAGPAANVVMGLLWTVPLWIYQHHSPLGEWTLLRDLGTAGVSINAAMIVFSALPLRPQIGGRLAAVLAKPLSRVPPIGNWLIVLLVVTGLAYATLFWPLVVVETLLNRLLGIDLTGL